MPRRHIVLITLLTLCPGLAAAGSHGSRSSKKKADILTTAARSSQFTTLVRAINAAELDEALRGRGPFTVFAPTDAAFAKLPKGTLESLLRPENRQQLRRVLLYHVVSGKISAAEGRRRAGAETLAGPRVPLTPRGSEGLEVDGARVVVADVGTDNGVVHAIDRVLLPPDLDLVETAAKAGDFGTLLRAAEVAGLDDVLEADGPITLLAPTDDAFSRLPKGTVRALLQPENRDVLRRVLANHIIHGRVYADEAARAGKADSAAHQRLFFGVSDGRLTVDGARIVRSDIDATNGVVHVIDRVLVPE